MPLSLLELLADGQVEEFNARRGRRAAPDLFAADLSGASLSGADLSGANLEKADLSGADLRDAVLAGADLSGADLTGANLTGAVAVKTRLREAYLGEAVLDGIDLSLADLTEAVLDDARGTGVVLRKARLKSAECRRVSLPGAQLQEARANGAIFEKADLTDAALGEASLQGANLEGATLSRADMRHVRGANANFKGASMEEAQLQKSDLTAIDLTDADLSGASMVEADMGDAIVTGCIFRGADMTHARLDGVDLAGADVTDAVGAQTPGMSLNLPSDRPRNVLFEDISAAVAGDTICLYWENEDDDETLVNRIAHLPGGRGFSGVAPALPCPAELTLARDIVQLGQTFAAVTFLDRPGGVELHVSQVGSAGRVGASTSVRLGYELAVQPIVRGGETVRVYGLGKRGPALHMHELVDGQLQHRFSQRASTARGLVGEVVATRGGVLIPIRRDGLGDPVQEPQGFAARMASSCSLPEGLALAWLPDDQKGFRWSVARSGERPTVTTAVEKHPVTSLTMTSLNDQPTVFFCREISQFGACGVWALTLAPGELPREVLVDERFDVDEVRVVGVADGRTTLLCTTLEGEVVLLSWAKGRSRVIEVLSA